MLKIKQYLPLILTTIVTSALTVLVCEKYIIRERIVYGASDYSNANFNGYNQKPGSKAMLTNFMNGGDFPNFRAAAQKAMPSAVHIKGMVRSRGGRFDSLFGGAGESSGSGVIITPDGYIITNNHVVEGSEDLKVNLADNREFSAEIIGTDPSTDLALIKIDAKALGDELLTPMEFGNSDELEVGDWVLAVGNPFNLNSTVTAGIVSAKGRNIDILPGEYSIESFIQTDAAVNPGNSGGALINPYGQLVGINSAIMTKTGRYEGYSFAIPVNLVKKVMRDLREFGEVQRGLLGVYIKNVDDATAKKQSMTNLDGVLLERVKSGEAAEEAGLKEGDVIIAANGIKVKTHPELQELVAQFRPGDKIDLEYLRDGKSSHATITLRNAQNTTALGKPLGNKSANDDSKLSNDALLKKIGADIRDLTSDEKAKFKYSKGAVVTSIKKDGSASKTNMEPGFIITKVDNQPVESAAEAIALIKIGGETVTLEGYYEEFKNDGFYSYLLKK